MSAKFSAYIGIDYSGAATPMSRSATIQVYEGRAEGSGRGSGWNELKSISVFSKS